MTTEKIRELLREQPFRPFVINLNDGRSLRVEHHDFIAVPPERTGTTVTLYEKGDVFHLVTVRNIASITRTAAPGATQMQETREGDDNGSPPEADGRSTRGPAA